MILRKSKDQMVFFSENLQLGSTKIACHMKQKIMLLKTFSTKNSFLSHT